MNLLDHNFWRQVQGLAFLGLLVLNLVALALEFRYRRDRFAPGRRWATRIFYGSVVATVALLYAATPPEQRAEFLRDRAGALGVILALPVLGLVWAAIAVARLRNSAVGRAVRQARRGDLPGAIAGLQAVVNRNLAAAAEPRPGAVDPADPWAAPSAASLGTIPRHRKQLAQQIGTLGELESQRGQWELALTDFRRAEGIDPTCPRYRANQAIALINLGRHGEGLELLDHAVAHLPPNDPLQAVQILRQAARVSLALGRLDAVGPLLDQADAALRRVPVPAPLRRPLARPLADLRRQLAEARARPPALDSASSSQEVAS